MFPALFGFMSNPLMRVAAVAAVMLLADVGSAQECEADSDCGEGYVCESQGIAPCAPTMRPACAMDDPNCDAQAFAPPDCEPREYKACVAAPCEADSDCPETMVCYAREVGVCSGGMTMAPVCLKAPCDPPPPPQPQEECTTSTIRECTPRYWLPCEQASDCGEGFTCEEGISVACSGSTGTMGSSGGTAGASGAGTAGAGAMMAPVDAGEAPRAGEAPALPLPADSCTSVPTGEFACQLKVMPCEADSACPAGMQCVANPSRSVCASTTPGTEQRPKMMTPGEAQDAGSPEPNNGQAAGGGDDPCAAINDGVPEKVCAPPDYGFASRDAVGSADGGIATSTGGTQQIPGQAASGGEPAPMAAGPGGESAHDTASSDDAGVTDVPASDRGCAVAAPGTRGATPLFGMLGMLGFCALVLWRRARRPA